MYKVKNCYKVVSKKSKKVHSKCATKKNAIRQIRLLNAIDHGFKLTRNYIKRR